jgi:hypothetical protein
MHYFVGMISIAFLSVATLSGCFAPVATAPPAYDDVMALRYAYPYSLSDNYYPYYGSVGIGPSQRRSDHHHWAHDREGRSSSGRPHSGSHGHNGAGAANGGAKNGGSGNGWLAAHGSYK